MIDDIGDARPCVGQIDELSNESTLCCWVRKELNIFMELDRKIHMCAYMRAIQRANFRQQINSILSLRNNYSLITSGNLKAQKII